MPKRPPSESDDDGDVRNATNHDNHFKRLRTASSGERSNGHAMPLKENDDAEDDDLDSQSHSDDERQDEEDELNDEETQEVDEHMQRSIHGGGSEADMGVIEKISLTNFMCHDRLEVRPGPKLNFIIGHNGSGKSAVLTGITVALGGKATDTDRGKSLKSFVKEGKQSALVEVTLKNMGSEAFKHDIYHDKIIVERTIRADGSGSWKMKNELGRLISTKREELNAICDHANIQVDNPMNILTQDSARKFLSSSHSDEKYQFFLRGTQLQQLAAEYDIVQQNSNRIRTLIGRKEQGLPMLKEKAQEAANLLEVIRKAADQKRLVQTLRNELVWAFVKEKEDELEAVVERLERLRIKREKIEANLAKSKDDEQKQEDAITELEKRSSETVERERPVLEEMKAIKEQERVFFSEIRNARDEEGALNDQYKRIKVQIDSLVGRIEVENQKVRDGNMDKRTGLLQQQKQAELERKKLEREEADEKDRLVEIEQENANLDRQLGGLEARREQLRSGVANAESMMANLRNAKSNRMTAFGQNIPALLQLIDRDTRWRQKPIGPIGAHLKLRDRHWAPVLESVIGNTLNAFCVTNHHDRSVLQELKRRANCNDVPILTGSDEAFDYAAGEPEAGILTILRVLDIESGFLTRQLINSVHIEQSALVPARSDGDVLMRRRVRNVKTCFSMDMFRLGGGNVGSSTQVLQPHKGPPRLSLDIETQLQAVHQRHAQEQDELHVVAREWEACQAKKNDALEERRRIRQKIPVLQRRARERHAEIERLDEELREDEPTNVAALVEAKKDLELELAKIVERYEAISARIEENERKMQPLVEQRLGLKKKLETMQEHSRTLKPLLDEAAKNRLKARSAGVHWENEREKILPKEEDLQSSVSVFERELQRVTAAAESVHARLPLRQSVSDYEKQIDSVEQQVVAAAKRHGADPEAINLQVQQYSQAFQKAHAEIQALKEALKDLDQAIRIRLDKWRLFRRMISVRAKNMFSHYLSIRGYTGSLIFDHNKGTLRLTVQTDEATVARKDKDPKSLSGGEKSFATICLLLALWEAIGCPIRCLDEFDVFMDAVNRRISMKMMIDAARGANGVQYILITPQSMASVNLGNDVRVHRLNDPERNQTTLT